jgi:Zn-dependent peptidase ImmA (M78 family)
VDFPNVNIPELDVPEDVRKITADMIEDFASECRVYWKLGDGPIADVVLLMENNGVVVSRGDLVAESLDAFSQWPTDSERPFVFLGADKASAVRSRHDASHELGHLVLHRNVDRKSIRNPVLFKLMENQAHRFALAFNLPAAGFANQLWSPTLDAFLALKPHWKIAIAAMIMRCEQLNILSEEQARRSWINMSRRGWRKREPLDDRLAPEQPRLLRRSFELLIKEGLKSPEQILSDLALNSSDIEALACLESGYLSGEEGQVMARPQLRPEYQGASTANLLHFTSRKKN